MRRLTALLLVVALAFAVPALAQAPLGWKLKDRFYVEVTTSQQQSMKVQGKPVDQNRDLSWLFVVQPQARSADGTRIIDLTVEVVKLTGPAKLATVEDPLLKALQGVELKVTLGPDLRVRQVDGLADVVKNLGGAKGTTIPESVRNTMLSSFEGVFAFLISEMLVPLPEKSVQNGAQWNQKSTLNLPYVGALTLQKELTYEGKGRLPYQALERVTAKGTFTYGSGKEGGGQLGGKVLNAEVKASEYKGTLHFDNAAGRLAHAEVKMKLDAAVLILLGKQRVQSSGVYEQTLTITASDKKPVPK